MRTFLRFHLQVESFRNKNTLTTIHSQVLWAVSTPKFEEFSRAIGLTGNLFYDAVTKFIRFPNIGQYISQ